MKHLFIIIIVLALFSACQNKEKAISADQVAGNKIMTINVNHPVDSVKGTLSLLCENFRTVRLETNDSCLFGNATYLIGKKYIISFSNANVILFDHTGKYLRTLSVQGRGPGEFAYITGKTINKTEDKIYAADYGKNIIHSWNLPDGQYTSIPLAEKGGAYTIKIADDTTLQIANLRDDKARYKLYSQSLSGKFLNGFPNRGNEDARRIDLSNNLYNAGSAMYYRPHHTDSVYQVLADTLMLKYAFPLTKDQQLKIIDFTDKKMFCSVFNITGKKTEEIVIKGSKITSISVDGYNTYYLIDIPEEKIICFHHLYDDYFGTEIKPERLSIQENGLFYVEYPATKLSALISEILEETNTDASIRDRMKQLQAEISEEDNPVLVVGNVKTKNL